ncbi:tol protein, partial [Paraphoma chrysanthemicola]
VYLREYLGQEATYACLSHCWGKEGPALQLTSHKVGELKCGVARAHLPRTFQDAVDICGKLNIKFLWIDALCILQDNLDDWTSTAQVMASIYENAYLTIAATGSDSTNGGCFSRLRDEYREIRLDSTGLYTRKLMPTFPMHEIPESDESDWPLLGRGWVCQERHLSTRVIHYAKDQLFWECSSTFRSSVDPDSPGSRTPNPIRDLTDHGHLDWTRFVQLYSGMRFTKSGDRLPALAGIVEREGLRRKDDMYVAGMWKSTLLQDLGFYGDENANVVPGLPSWSWVSIQDHVRFWTIMRGTRTTTLAGLDFNSEGSPNMGKVKSASIRLKGPTL